MSSEEKMIRCTKCGALNESNRFYCSECKFNLHMVYSGPPVQQKGPEPSPGETIMEEDWRQGTETSDNDDRSPPGQDLEGRYRDAYSLASIVISIGGFVKVFGVILGILLALPAGGFDAGLLVLGTLLGAAFLGLVVYVLGLLLTAQGQILRATLDSAVNSFSNLPEAQKRRLMGLQSQS